MTDDGGTHCRRSIRLQEYDYSQTGAYFITVCTQNRERLFGDIVDGKMVLNPFGKIASEQWYAIPERFPHVDMDVSSDDGVTEMDNRATARVAPTVGEIVGAYKSICYRECLAWINNHEQDRRLGRLWQRNYWEHVIRNEMEFNRIREYIHGNPTQWESDRLNPRRGDPCGRPTPMIRERRPNYAMEGWMV